MNRACPREASLLSNWSKSRPFAGRWQGQQCQDYRVLSALVAAPGGTFHFLELKPQYLQGTPEMAHVLKSFQDMVTLSKMGLKAEPELTSLNMKPVAEKTKVAAASS